MNENSPAPERRVRQGMDYGETEDVQQVHAAIQREKREPLAGSEIVNGGSKRVGMIVLKGLQGPITVKGQSFGTAVMQPWEKTLTDAKIADVITYIRQEWGNKGGPVSKEGIAGLRKELASHPDSFTEATLHEVPEDAELAGGESAGPKPADAPSPAPPPKQ